MPGFSTVIQKVRGEFVTRIANTYGYTVAYDNQQFTPVNRQDPWLQFRVGAVTPAVAGFGAGLRMRKFGQFEVDIHVPLASGDAAALVIADNIYNVFSNKVLSGVTYRSVTQDGSGGEEEGFWVLPVSCVFYMDEIES